MIEAARLLEGEHDFTAFAAADPVDATGRSKVRRIFSSCLTREGDRLIYRVRGSGFLKHMVRNIVGVLLEVGKGNLAPADIEARLQPGCKIPCGSVGSGAGVVFGERGVWGARRAGAGDNITLSSSKIQSGGTLSRRLRKPDPEIDLAPPCVRHHKTVKPRLGTSQASISSNQPGVSLGDGYGH